MAGRVPAKHRGRTQPKTSSPPCTSNREGFTDAEIALLDFTTARHRPPLDPDADRDAPMRDFTPTQIVEVGLLAAMCLVGRFSQIAGLEEPM